MFARDCRNLPAGTMLLLNRQAAIEPSESATIMPVLGKMTRLRVWNGGPSPTGIPHELPVTYLDAAGIERHGWLEPWALVAKFSSQHKPLKKAEPYDTHAGLSPLDLLRNAAHTDRITVFQSVARNRKQLKPLLRKVIRELGGNTDKSDDPDTIAVKALSMLHDREVTMKDVKGAKKTKRVVEEVEEQDEDEEQEEQAERPARKSKKAKAAKAEKGEGGRSNSMRVSAGNALVPLLPKGPARKAAQRLQENEELSKKELIALRDGVNEAAAAAREAGDGKTASKLSAANRIVRRLARSA